MRITARSKATLYSLCVQIHTFSQIQSCCLWYILYLTNALVQSYYLLFFWRMQGQTVPGANTGYMPCSRAQHWNYSADPAVWTSNFLIKDTACWAKQRPHDTYRGESKACGLSARSRIYPAPSMLRAFLLGFKPETFWTQEQRPNLLSHTHLPMKCQRWCVRGWKGLNDTVLWHTALNRASSQPCYAMPSQDLFVRCIPPDALLLDGCSWSARHASPQWRWQAVCLVWGWAGTAGQSLGGPALMFPPYSWAGTNILAALSEKLVHTWVLLTWYNSEIIVRSQPLSLFIILMIRRIIFPDSR